MAILKHINIRNKDYSVSVRYLWFEHDEKTGKPIRGEDGHCIRRDGVIMDSINCGIISFDFDCRMVNKNFGKNQHECDIKAHHWILSFDPEDIERGLTPEKAQEMGMEFAQKHFGGHQCVIATHNDGHNGSKNIHVHIVCNSLRIHDLPEQPAYSQFERDRKAGYKLHPTRAMMEYLKADVMLFCQEYGLNQVELNKLAKKRVTDKEYRVQQRGRKKDLSFKTDLEKLREAIDTARQRATSVEDFKRILAEEHHIIVKETRGRWSYLPEGRKCPVTWRRLGTNYQREFIEKFIAGRERTVHKKIEKIESQKVTQISQITAVTVKTAVIGRLIDLNDPKIQASYGLRQWAKIQNLKEMSRRFNYLSENGMLDLEKLSDEIISQKEQLQDGKDELKAVEERLKEVNMLRRLLAQYYSTRNVYNEYRRSYKSPTFRQQHISEITLYEGAQKQLNAWQKEHNGEKIPSDRHLKQEKAVLTERKEQLYAERRGLKETIKMMEESHQMFATESQKKQEKYLMKDIE